MFIIKVVCKSNFYFLIFFNIQISQGSTPLCTIYFDKGWQEIGRQEAPKHQSTPQCWRSAT